MSIGDRIRKVRTIKGYSQQFIADSLAISQSKFNRIENGSSNISVDDLLKVCELLDVNLPQILTAEKNSNDKTSPNKSIVENMEDLFSKEKAIYEEQIAILKKEAIELREQLSSLIKILTKPN